jgi:hypothetical protein
MTDKLLILQTGEKRNWESWCENLEDFCGTLYGIMSGVLVTMKRPVIAAVKDPDDEDVERLTAGEKKDLRVSALKARQKKIDKMEEDGLKMYSHLWTHMSQDSKQLIRNHEKF